MNEVYAYELDNGDLFFFMNGVLHREDGPAVIRVSGTQEWYQEGVLHRDNDLPALIHWTGRQEWYHKGLLHRDNDLPAYISATGKLLKWYQYGILHRGNDLPAIFEKDKLSIWYKDGQMHRDVNQFGVANAAMNGFKKDGTEVTKWYLHGKLHRDMNNPAAIFSYPDGSQMRKWFNHGVLTRNFEPAVIWESGGEGFEMWYQDGVITRNDDLPSIIFSSGAEHWYKDGVLHRENDLPAVISREWNEWRINGKLHRDGNPALINNNGRAQLWCDNGIVYRAIFKHDDLIQDMVRISEEKFTNVLYREESNEKLEIEVNEEYVIALLKDLEYTFYV